MNDDGQWLPKSELLHDRNAPAILDDVPNIIDEEDDLVMFQNCVFAVNAGHYAIITNPAHCDAEDPSMPDYVLVKAKELEETYLRHFSFGEKRKRLTVRELRKYMERRSLSTEPSRVRVDDKYVYIGSLMYEPVPHSPISTALFDLLNHVMPETRQRSYLKAFIASLCKGQIASPPSFASFPLPALCTRRDREVYAVRRNSQGCWRHQVRSRIRHCKRHWERIRRRQLREAPSNGL